ncbi:MAG: hypothetical protein NT091_00500, partial [Candidatus Falkowbacteria bacterium]|nr:hypothetical protein [Candidatus Falkowbacteria bacterium]
MFKIFHNLENSRTSLIWFMLSFLVFVSIRNFLEIFSDKAVFSDFNNYFLFYISLLLSSVILFRLFTNESIVKLLKILLTFYAIIITPPLIDLLLSFGKGYDMAYMYSIDNIVKSYFLFFGDWTGKGITPGIRTEVFFVLIFSFAYVFNKTKNWIKSALFCLSFYSLLFSYLAVPVFLQVIMSALNLPINLEYDFRINEISIYLYLILIFLTLLSIFKYYNQEYFMAIMKDARWLRAFYYIFMFVFGAIFAESSFSIFKGVDNVDSMISFLKFVVIMIAIFLAWIFSLMINNIVDQDIDKISNQARPL